MKRSSGGRSVAVCLAAGLAVALAAGTSGAQKLTTISVAQPFVNVLPAGLWVAKDRGFFRKYGVDLQIITFRGSTQGMQAMLAGQVGILLGSPGQGLAADAEGQDVVGLGTLGGKMPYFFVARPEIKTPADLRGKKIGVSGTGLSAARIAVILALNRLGLDLKRDNIVLVPTGTVPERVTGLRTNAIQATVVDRTDTPVSAIKAFGFTILADLSTLNIPWEQDILMTTRRYLQANRAAVAGLMQGFVEGNAYVLDPRNKRASLRIIAENLQFDNVEQAAPLYDDAVANFIVRKPYVSRDALVALVGIVKDEFPELQKVNLDQFIDSSILRQLDQSGFIDHLARP